MTKEQALEGVEKIIGWFHQAVTNNSLSGISDRTVSNYVSYQEYVMDLRSRLSRASWEIGRLAYDADLKHKRLDLVSRKMQAEKQLHYEEQARDEGYSKSQAETQGRKRAEKDEEYIALREELNEASANHYDYINIKWAITNVMNAMAQYNRSSFDN